jgi:hypothetical protein
MENTVKIKNQTIQISFHAELRMKERFGNEFKLEDALGRGKTLNTDNVKMFPWLRKKLMNNLHTASKFIVNPYYNFQAVIEHGVLITVEYLDASHTEYGRRNYNYSK